MAPRLSIRAKLLLSTLVILLTSYALLLIPIVTSINRYLKNDIDQDLQANLNYTRAQFMSRIDQVRSTLQVPAAAGPLLENFRNRDLAWLREAMGRWSASHPFLDVLTIIDRERNVVVRLRSRAAGDRFELKSIIERAFRTRTAVTAAELVPAGQLCREGLREYCSPPLADGQAMMMTAVIPLLAKDGQILGALVAGDVLNRDPSLPFQVQQIFGKDAHVAVI